MRLVGAAMLVTVTASAPAGALSQEFQYPLTAAVGTDDVLYIADRNLPGLWKAAGGKLEVFFQASRKFRTPLNAVRCVAVDPHGRVLAGDSSTREVYRFEQPGQPTPLTAGGIGIPMDIAVDPKGNLFVTDLELHRVWKVPAAGGPPVEFAAVEGPRGIAIDSHNRLWVVAHSPKYCLVRLDAEGQLETVLAGRKFEFGHEVVVDSEHNRAYVTDGYAKTVWQIDTQSGQMHKLVSGEPLQNPVGLERRGDHLLVVDPRARAVFQLTLDGKLTQIVPAN